MKKFYIIILALVFSLNLSSEEFLNEDFSTWLPAGWSVIDGPGGTYYSHWFQRDGEFATVYITGDNQDEWLITPEITLPPSGELRLSADMMGSFYRMVTADYGDVFVNVSTDNGLNWETIWVEDNQEIVEASGVTWPYQSNTWFFPSININEYAGLTVKFAFRYVAPDGDADWWNLDNVIVKSLIENEVELQQFVFPEYGVLNDEFSFEGTFKNYGENDVISFEAVYSVNGVDSEPYVVDNVSIAYNTTFTFIHDIPFTFTDAEIYDLSLNITKVNGTIDPTPDNNILYRDISIATEVVSRKPLFEVFTSSSCAACPGTNEALDEVLANNPGDFSLVKYQVYWPGIGDPYYIIDDSIRAVYYNVGGVPDVYSNGVYILANNFSQGMFNAAAAEGAFAEIVLAYSFNGTNVNVDLSITPTINITDASVHIAIVEKTTYDNVGNNGETEFHNVLMKMLPGPYGNPIVLTPGVAFNIQESAELSDTFIEEFDDLQVVAWVQDNETRYVMQSESSDLMVGIDCEPAQTLRIFPNPADDVLVVNTIESSLLQIHDVMGKIVLEQKVGSGSSVIDIRFMPGGVYILKTLSDNRIVETVKFVKH